MGISSSTWLDYTEKVGLNSAAFSRRILLASAIKLDSESQCVDIDEAYIEAKDIENVLLGMPTNFQAIPGAAGSLNKPLNGLSSPV